MFQVQAFVADRTYIYTFDDQFELTDWLQWEGGDFDRILVDGVEVG